jgi:hypothetical protein
VTVGADVDHYHPTFDADSIFNWFTHNPNTTAQGRVAVRITSQIDLAAQGGVRLFATDGDPDDFGSAQCEAIRSSGETDADGKAERCLDGLARYGIAMWLAMIPAALALGLDERLLREAPIWLKPLKFLASLGLFALTTVWFIGLLPEARRRAWPVRAAVWTLIAAGSFEIVYIVLQAALGAGSHYNVGDPLHAVLYSLMGLGALALTATQPALAWLLLRHADPRRAPAYRLAVVIGLVLALQQAELITDPKVTSGFVLVLLFMKGPLEHLVSTLPIVSRAQIAFRRIACGRCGVA